MSTRAEILEALSESETGLTLKQIAEFCSACEYDEQVVGTMIAILHRENVIHPGPEIDGLKTWIFGKEAEEVVEAHISLAGGDSRPQTVVSEAARAIAKMRGGSDQQPTRAGRPADPEVATMQSQARETARVKVLRILKAQGPLQSREIRKHGGFGANLPHTLAVMVEQKELVRLGGGPRSTIFGLPGQTVKNQKDSSVKGREPAPLSRDRNGGGGAVTSAAGPAVAQPLHREIHAALGRNAAERLTPGKSDDALYAAAITDLQERRAALQQQSDAIAAQMAKVDRAIEAMRELA